jgi:hypothetical protein
MSKYYFDLDKIEWISIAPESEYLGYMWVDTTPPVVKKFLGIPIWKNEGTPSGWYNLSSGEIIKELNSSSWYRVDTDVKKIFRKPSIRINFGYKQTLTFYFDSNSEAQSYVDEMVMESGKKFKIIEEK